MPIYEYECEKCHEKFEMFRSITENDNDVACPRCGGKQTKRVISSFATTGTDCGGHAEASCGGG
ncbi:zinc ribbon domain-containing protein [Chloroflexota bacterium]